MLKKTRRGCSSSSGDAAFTLPKLVRPPSITATSQSSCSSSYGAATTTDLTLQLIAEEGANRKIVVMKEALERRRVHRTCLPQAPSTASSGSSSCSPASGLADLPGVQMSDMCFNAPTRGAAQAESPTTRGRRAAATRDLTELVGMVQRGEYVDGYFAASVQLDNRTLDKQHIAVLHGLRGRCNYRLMNFKESAEDLNDFFLEIRAVRCICEDTDSTATVEAETRSDVGYLTRSFIFLLLENFIKALSIVEDYDGASRVTGWLLSNATAGESAKTPNTEKFVCTPLETLTLQQYAQAIPTTQEFRLCVREEKWKKASALFDSARALLADTPLVTLQAAVLLECGEPQLARDLLLPYLPSIPSPPPPPSPCAGEQQLGEGGAAASRSPVTPEEYELRSSVTPHYLLSTVLLAKASIYCGRLYANIAAVLVARCLRLDPVYSPAVVVGNYLVALEDCFSRVRAAREAQDWARAEQTIAEALELDSANHKVAAGLLLERAEVYLETGRFAAAVQDCDDCLARDSQLAKAFVTRGDAYEGLGLHARAEADRATARAMNPMYAAVIAEKERRKRAAAAAASATQYPSAERPRSERRSRPFSSTGSSFSGGGSSRPRSATRASPPPPRNGGAAQSARNSSLYDDLQISRTATQLEVRQAFRQLTLRYHPDKVVGASDEHKLFCLEQFKRVNHAYSILSDPTRRAEYDSTLLNTFT